jgi:cyclopropane fatty-acyl-phospholipid synthase-like methyltransferase
MNVSRMAARMTDWDGYYSRPYKAASLTRRYTASVLVGLMRAEGLRLGRPLSILEIGGANSCFIDRIVGDLAPGRYDVMDSNELGLDLLRRRLDNGRIAATAVAAAKGDVLDPTFERSYDVVYSVGLIEHFSPENTAKAVASHFGALASGGLAVITFPTPTFLYKVVRRLAELMGLWIFHDERPILLDEFAAAARDHGSIVSARILWPLVLTQYCVALRKPGSGLCPAAQPPRTSQ